ncbi:hypothetical protein ENBRE01_0896 [Enteropsectra breve]|nr:hypothetical protein ENBRE01_0896 [Enteropsectra breve]
MIGKAYVILALNVLIRCAEDQSGRKTPEDISEQKSLSEFYSQEYKAARDKLASLDSEFSCMKIDGNAHAFINGYDLTEMYMELNRKYNDKSFEVKTYLYKLVLMYNLLKDDHNKINQKMKETVHQNLREINDMIELLTKGGDTHANDNDKLAQDEKRKLTINGIKVCDPVFSHLIAVRNLGKKISSEYSSLKKSTSFSKEENDFLDNAGNTPMAPEEAINILKSDESSHNTDSDEEPAAMSDSYKKIFRLIKVSCLLEEEKDNTEIGRNKADTELSNLIVKKESMAPRIVILAQQETGNQSEPDSETLNKEQAQYDSYQKQIEDLNKKIEEYDSNKILYGAMEDYLQKKINEDTLKFVSESKQGDDADQKHHAKKLIEKLNKKAKKSLREENHLKSAQKEYKYFKSIFIDKLPKRHGDFKDLNNTKLRRSQSFSELQQPVIQSPTAVPIGTPGVTATGTPKDIPKDNPINPKSKLRIFIERALLTGICIIMGGALFVLCYMIFKNESIPSVEV